MKWKKRAASLLLASGMALTSVPAFAVDTIQSAEQQADIIDSGTCGVYSENNGQNVRWTLDSNGTLTISGNGDMGSRLWQNQHKLDIDRVVIQPGVTSIYSSAFSDCDGLTSVSIAEGVTVIGSYAFHNCDALKEITLPNSTKTIGQGAFSSCDSLERISMPSTITSIGNSAFEYCRYLKDIQLPERITEISEALFRGCQSLTDITIPERVTSIEASAFRGCESLKTIIVPERVTTIGSRAFDEAKNLNSIYFKGHAPIVLNNSFSGVKATGYYPAGDDTWTDAVLDSFRNYWKDITWQTWNPATDTPDEPDTPDSPQTSNLDVWGFSNSQSAFGQTNEGYYITKNDYNRLKKNLLPVDKDGAILSINGRDNFNVDGKKNASRDNIRKWTGSCYGMSAWVCLVNSGNKEASNVDGNLTSLNSASISANNNSAIESAINYYHFQQKLTSISKITDNFMSMNSQLGQLKMLEDFIGNGNPVMIRLQWYQQDGSSTFIHNRDSLAGHVVVGYAVESGSYEKTANGVLDTYNKRVRIYDPSHPTDTSGNYDLYYNDSTGVWCIPGVETYWQIRSTSSATADSKGNNGRLKLVTKTIGAYGAVDFNASARGLETAAASDDAFVALTNASGSDYTLKWGNNSANISGMTVTGSNSNQINVSVMENTTPDGNITEPITTAFLPDANSYTVQSAENLAYQLNTGDYLVSAKADSSGSVTFNKNGKAELNTNSSADYTVRVTANNSNLSWYTIEVNGEDAKSASAELTNNGVIVDSDNLNNITVTGTNDDETVDLDVSSNKDTVLVTEDNGNLVVKEDSNNDGSYDKVIAHADTPSTPSTPSGSVTRIFSDVHESDWFVDYVQYVYDNNLMTGTGKTTFGPSVELTRAMVAQILYANAGSPTVGTSSRFSDVKSDDWFGKAVSWAAGKGIVSGYSNGTFQPNKKISRQEFAAMLYSAKGKPNASGSLSYPDASSVAAWAKTPITWAVQKGIISGTMKNGITILDPQGNATRAQAAAMIMQFIEKT